jgi:hypothetical protein
MSGSRWNSLWIRIGSPRPFFSIQSSPAVIKKECAAAILIGDDSDAVSRIWSLTRAFTTSPDDATICCHCHKKKPRKPKCPRRRQEACLADICVVGCGWSEFGERTPWEECRDADCCKSASYFGSSYCSSASRSVHFALLRARSRRNDLAFRHSLLEVLDPNDHRLVMM